MSTILEFKMAGTQIMKKHILLNFVKIVAYLYMNCTPLNCRGQETIYWLNVGHIEFKMANTQTVEKV